MATMTLGGARTVLARGLGPWVGLAACLASCEPRTEPAEGGSRPVEDASALDATADAALVDGDPSDATLPPDSAPPDAGPSDTGPPDTGPPDTGPPDTGPPDTGPSDIGLPDAVRPDARAPDTGRPDTGPVDAGVLSGQRSCPVADEPGCGLVETPSGTFTMGVATSSEPCTGTSEACNAAPLQGPITVSAFALDRYEVTVARFRRFWNATPTPHPEPAGPIVYPGGRIEWAGRVQNERDLADVSEWCNWPAHGRDLHPINCVTWWTAQAFCAWDGGRLPTEAEWEYAARGRRVDGLPVPRRYPWGDAEPRADTTTPCDRAHLQRCAGEDGAATRRVGRFPATAGMFDLAGNVWEWTADEFRAYSAADSPACRRGTATSRTDPLCQFDARNDRVIRGGSWRTDGLGARAASRFGITPRGLIADAPPLTFSPGSHLGFRCARTR